MSHSELVFPRRTGDRLEGRRARLYAALDLGTHNCRMLIARRDALEGFRVLQSFSRPVRLGEGLAATGVLAEAAVERALSALAMCARRVSRSGVRRIRSVATEPCRRAGNAAIFLERVRDEVGLELEPVSAADEAGLTLVGCRPLLDPRFRRVLLFDIGGGSTEVSWIAQAPDAPPQVRGLVSLPLGVVDFAERFGGDCIPPAVFAEMTAIVDRGLAALDTEHRIGAFVRAGEVQMIGTSGTVTTLAASYLGLRRYDRARVDGLDIDLSDVAAISARLAASTWAERADNPCIGRHRADLVVAGCAILDAVCRRWPVARLRVADRGIREGLLMSMMAEDDGWRDQPAGKP